MQFDSKTVLSWLVIVCAMATGPLRAEPVTLKMPDGLVARAEYRQGRSIKPAVLILHGFLQTHEFSTVHRLTDGLAGEGYPVLAPTLTLGITQRKQSLACEAIHTHTLQDDFRELDAWLGWLKKKGHTHIVLLGHSHGSTELMAYVLRGPAVPIDKLIAVSIVEVVSSRDSAVNQALERQLRQLRERGERGPVSRPLSFCRKFVATPESFLSYLEWSPERILASIRKVSIPYTLIMGGHDERLGPGWIERLHETGKTVRMIPGANHFLDGQHEFDLLDVVLAELRQS